ncbi:MAG: ATP-binding protein [bacterium]|nr:ATP-binding protein [bacterium]
MHHILERQVRKFFKEGTPLSLDIQTLLKIVSDTYDNYDKDRQFMERSFDLSSEEFMELNHKIVKLFEELKAEKESVEQKVVQRTQELKQKIEELNISNQLLIKREEDLVRANDRLRELDKIKTEFISVAAHQLRTPLSAIKWTLSLLIDEHSDNLNPKQRSLLQKGFESNERIITLVNEMLVVTRIESGKMRYDFTFIHTEDLIDSVLSDFVSPAKVRNINLSYEKPPISLPRINADPGKIRAVLQNLIENAIFYTREGGRVTVSTKIENDFVKFIVNDNGIGIPEQQQSSIFTKFFRADNAVRLETDGSGLGLFIAKSIVDKHGGAIGFDSKENIGTTFYFTIPIVGIPM